MDVMEMIEFFEMPEDYAEQIAYIKEEFVKEDYYGRIEGALATVRNTRRNPFELIEEFFKP